MRTCGVLASLWSAQLGKDYFSTLKQALLPAHLPPTLIDTPATTDQAEEIMSFEKEGKTAQDLIEESDVIQRSNGLSYHDLSIEVIAIADVDKDGLNDYIVSRSYSTGTDSSYSVGYLSPTQARKASRWIQFDQSNMSLPQIP